VNDLFSEVLAYICFAAASALTAVCTLHTFQMAAHGALFKPKPKWGPLNLMKLTHEVLRAGLPKLVSNLDVLSGLSNPVALKYFIREFEAVLTVYIEHGRHEDEVVFPVVRRFFPGLNPSMDEEHEMQHAQVKSLQDLVAQYNETKNGAAFIDAFKPLYTAWVANVLAHLRNEEETITVVARKYIGVEAQCQIVEKMYDLSSAEAWGVVIPYAVKHLPIPMWRVRYLNCLIWSNPSKAQEIGLMLYRRVDDVTWAFLTREIPSLVPRGLPGHQKIF
jgi:hemerythrin-like domain-containing protein